MKDNWRKFKALSKKEKALLIKATCLLPMIRLALFTLGYYRTKRILEKTTAFQKTDGSPGAATLEKIAAIGRIVSIAGQHGFYQASCLHKALLVWWLLRKEQVFTDICFGSRIDRGKFQAHAWIEYQGLLVFGGENSRSDFQILSPELPPREKTA